MDFDIDFAAVASNAFFGGSVADVTKDFSGNFFVIRVEFAGDFTSDEDVFVGGKNLTGNVGIWVTCKCSVKNRVRDLVADLVRMSFADGFARE